MPMLFWASLVPWPMLAAMDETICRYLNNGLIFEGRLERAADRPPTPTPTPNKTNSNVSSSYKKKNKELQ